MSDVFLTHATGAGIFRCQSSSVSPLSSFSMCSSTSRTSSFLALTESYSLRQSLWSVSRACICITF